MTSVPLNGERASKQAAEETHLFSLRGVVDDSEVERFVEAIRHLGPEVLVAVDFRHAREVHDLAILRLAHAIADRRAVALGVFEHHLKVLRYLGVPVCTRVAPSVERDARGA